MLFNRVVEPKRQRLNAAQSQLREKQAMLQEAKDKLAEVRFHTQLCYFIVACSENAHIYRTFYC